MSATLEHMDEEKLQLDVRIFVEETLESMGAVITNEDFERTVEQIVHAFRWMLPPPRLKRKRGNHFADTDNLVGTKGPART